MYKHKILIFLLKFHTKLEFNEVMVRHELTLFCIGEQFRFFFLIS